MHISILTFDLSHNCLGRAHVLARLLERNHSVEIVGPERGDGIWSPLRGHHEYKRVNTEGMLYEFPFKVNQYLSKITGDVVYASKPRTASFGVGLLASIRGEIPLVLDIDDWELGFAYSDVHPLLTHIKSAKRMLNVNSPNYTWLLERFVSNADALTVSNTFLKERYGGEIIPHARDTDEFDPSKFDSDEIRDELDLPKNRKLVMFFGSPKSHKGVEYLVEAIQTMDRDDVMGVIVGAGDSGYSARLREIAGDDVIVRGKQPFDQLPKWIATADIMTAPQRRVPATRGQLPAKVFDAMSMAKPVIATDVSDLSQILDDCGIIVSPDSPSEIAAAIEYLVNNPEEREAMGQRARERCIAKYSYDALAPKLDQLVRRVA